MLEEHAVGENFKIASGSQKERQPPFPEHSLAKLPRHGAKEKGSVSEWVTMPLHRKLGGGKE